MTLHVHRAVLLVALAALVLGVAALAGAPGAQASVPTFTIVDVDGNAIPDVVDSAGVTHNDATTIAGTGVEMLVVAIEGQETTWRLTAQRTGAVTVDGYSGISFSGIAGLSGASGGDTFVFLAPFSLGMSIAGGGGFNTLDYSALTTSVLVNLATGSASGTPGISGIRNAIGGAGMDSLTGDGESNTFTGGPGADTFTGYAGLDTVVETRDADFTLTSTRLTIGSEGNDTLSGIEAARLTGGAGDNTLDASTFTAGRAELDGGGGNDTLKSGTGDDLLIGGAGDDVMSGGPGRDEYRGGLGANTIIEAIAGGADMVSEDCDGDFTLSAEGLVWSDGSDNAGIGLAYIEDIWLSGGPGDNGFTISALAGKSFHVAGGEGLDSVAVDPHGMIDLYDGGIIVPSLDWSTTLDSVEAVTVVGLLQMPADVTVEATSAAGAVVDFAATADDTLGGPVAVTCDPASGSTFPLGSTTVVCTGTDASGDQVVDSFEVTVVDTTAPVLHLPADLTVRATSAAGALVDFSATAEDAVDGAVAVTCDPASGSVFPIGSTTVDCRASDAAGNTVSGSFTVTVSSATHGWTGFLQPINADGSSVFKLKSTVPVKFALTGDSAGIADLAAGFYCAKVSSGVAGDEVEAVSTSAASTGNLFRYDPLSGQYIFNWGTKGLTVGTYRIRVDLGDGVAHTVLVSLK